MKIIVTVCLMTMMMINPRLPEVFRVTLLPEVGYIIPQSHLANYAAPRIEKLTFH